jgi:UDPglucose 6-dehydrogenase
LSRTAIENDYEFGILDAVMHANERQKLVIPHKVLTYFKDEIEGLTFAVWGLAFKDNTDDVRESPALTIIKKLIMDGAKINAFDPQANEPTRRELGDNNINYFEDEYEALSGADALIIATNWREFSVPDFNKIKKLLKKPVIFDGRNMYGLEEMQENGFHYESIGRKTVD